MESELALALIKSLFVLRLSNSKKSNFFELLFFLFSSATSNSSDITLTVDSKACLSFSFKFEALVFDEYDAGRPDVMFVIQRVLEAEGNFTLLDKNKVIKQNKFFRLFATSNTVGLGDTTGLYHGTQQINQGQMDRWNIVTTLNYLGLDKEMEIILGKNKNLNNPKGKEKVANMIKVATLTRKGFMAGDISTVMSPRTVLHWAENSEIFKDTGYAFRVTFLNKCDEVEKNTIAEYYQRCFGEDLPESMINVQV